MEINVNDLITSIGEYNLSVHKLTYRFGIDYIKYNKGFREKYPEIIDELMDIYIPRKVAFKEFPSIDDNMIECGNSYELETMISIPDPNIVRTDSGTIEGLNWVLTEDVDSNVIENYRKNLVSNFKVNGEYINKMKYLKREVLKYLTNNGVCKDTFPHIIKSLYLPYKTVDGDFELEVHNHPLVQLTFIKDSVIETNKTNGNPLNTDSFNVGHFLIVSIESVLRNTHFNYGYFEIINFLYDFEDYITKEYNFIGDRLLIDNKVININNLLKNK